MLTDMLNKLDFSEADSLSLTRLSIYIALSYALLGAFGLMLAIGPGYASPIFPAAGLALAVTLFFGRRALPGVWLGSVAINTFVPLLHGSLIPTTAALALLIACGATAQAWIGSWLINHWQKSGWRNLERELDALIFLLLGGVLSCLLSAAVGVTALYAAGVIKPADFIFSYWNWYVGDTLGVLIFAPLMLQLLKKSPERWPDWKRFAFVPMLLLTGLLWLAFYGSTLLIAKEQEAQLKTDCEVMTKRIADRLLTHREVLASLRNFIKATPGFSFRQFELFTRITLQDNPDIFALSYNDLVAIEQRPLYERNMSGLTPGGTFRITERDSQQKLVSAARRPEYVAVRYIVPLAGNLPAVGFDIHSEPIRRDAINRARAAQSMAVTAPIQLVQEHKKRVGVLELLPVLDNPEIGVGEQKAGRLLGFAVSVVKVDEMIEIATKGHVPPGLLFWVTDPHAAKGREQLYRSDAVISGNSFSDQAGDWKTELRMGHRNWEFTARATGEYLQQHRPLLAWIAGAVAIFFTGLIQLLIIGMSGRLNEIKRTNNAVNAYLDKLFNDTNVPIIVWDSNFKITRFSRACEILSGRSAEEVISKDIATVFAGSARDSSLELFKKNVTGTQWESVELPVMHVNGSVSTILWNASAIIGDDGVTPVATIAQGHDITTRKRVEDELQQRTHELGDTNVQLELEMAERQRAQEDLAVKQSQLEALNRSLQLRIDESVAEIRRKDQVMISQSRQAAMGEMIGNIAHQWRQPLNALAMVLGNIKSAFQYNELTEQYLDKTVDNGNRLLQKMSTTINDFSNFFLPDKEVLHFSAREQINQAVALVETSLISQNISVHLDAPQDLTLTGFPNEYSQVLLNLLANARDAIKESAVPEGRITIRLYQQDGQGIVSVSDNGGGIDSAVIDKIFEPYFSTKEMGTGIGLYMSKMIVERSMNGTISAHNIVGGTEFIIVSPMEGTLP
jgi:PAS domain S-box-containing protein